MRLILASGSASRQSLLRNAGVKFFAIPASVDEEAIKRDFTGPPPELAMSLAQAKAAMVAEHYPEDLVIGADQLLVCEGAMYSKPRTPDEAAEHLRRLCGRAHTLVTAACILTGAERTWSNIAEARLAMRPLSEMFIQSYVAAERLHVCTTVGAYQLEGRGAQLFSHIEGDFFTVLGLNLLPMLEFLRAAGVLPA